MYKVYIISHLRAKNVPKIEGIIGTECYWYVGKGEKEEYELYGAKNVVESGGLMESRNAALDDAFSENKICVQVSDDISYIRFVKDPLGTGLKRGDTDDISFKLAIGYIMKSMDKYPECKMAGCPPTDNPYFYTGAEYDTNKFIVGDLIVIKPSDLRFDTNLTLKEDYDFTLAHLKKFGCALRCNRVINTFAHRTNAGGAVDYRTTNEEQRNINYLTEKWGDMLVTNSKKTRPNEILFTRKKEPWRVFFSNKK